MAPSGARGNWHGANGMSAIRTCAAESKSSPACSAEPEVGADPTVTMEGADKPGGRKHIRAARSNSSQNEPQGHPRQAGGQLRPDCCEDRGWWRCSEGAGGGADYRSRRIAFSEWDGRRVLSSYSSSSRTSLCFFRLRSKRVRPQRSVSRLFSFLRMWCHMTRL